MNNFERLEYLIGKEKLSKLKASKVAVIGLGGVGGICALTLARSGIGTLIIQDFDVVTETNINRQVIAYYDTIGKNKAELVAEEIARINPDCQVTVLKEKFNSESHLFEFPFDFLVDCIDSVPDKYLLITECLKQSVPFVSSMGAAKKMDLKKLAIMDLAKTAYDPLAKVIRKKLRDAGVFETVMVVSSTEAPAPIEKLGSYMPVTATAGIMLADYAIKQLLKG
jgi:tRNA A37 threonylcarbamoyladenosine dehydratase